MLTRLILDSSFITDVLLTSRDPLILELSLFRAVSLTNIPPRSHRLFYHKLRRLTETVTFIARSFLIVTEDKV